VVVFSTLPFIFVEDFFPFGVQYEVRRSHLPGYSGVSTWQPTAGAKVMSGTLTTKGQCLSSVALRSSSLQLLEQ